MAWRTKVLELLTAGGHQVDNRKATADELVKLIGQYDGLVVRSRRPR